MDNPKPERNFNHPKNNELSTRVIRTDKEEWSTQTMESLRDTKEELEAIFNQVRDGIVVLDLTGKIMKINKRITDITGYTEEEIVGKRFTLLKMFTPQSIANMFVSFSKSLSGIEILPYEVEGYAKNGERLIGEISGALLRKNGKPTGVVTVIRDITERKRAEEALGVSEKRFAIIFDTQLHGIIIINAQSHAIVDVNTYAAKIIGLPREDIIGKICHSFICSAQKGQCPVTDLGQAIDQSERILTQTGSNRTPILKSVTRTTINGEELLIESFQDITERKQMEQQLSQSEWRYRTIADNVNLGINLIDLDHTIVMTNAAISKGFEKSITEIIGEKCFRIFEKRNAVCPHCPGVRTIASGKPAEVETEGVRDDGSRINVRLQTFPVVGDNGKVTRFIEISEDISERKRAEEDLRESFERLRRSLETTIMALASTVEMRDPYTAGHQQRVADLASAIAEEMGLSDEQIYGIRFAGLIHDIGKINIPAEILNRPGKLTEIEYSFLKNHPQAGYDVLKTIEFPWPVAQIVLQHHERMDASGYPNGLSGADIILEARILAVADIVEAIATHRPYRPARGLGDALEEILHNKGIFYDPDVVDACLRIFYEKGFTFK
jgi:PAS domain S-box-containing protein/putative nucleotidyltransferase with HDIG domain